MFTTSIEVSPPRNVVNHEKIILVGGVLKIRAPIAGPCFCRKENDIHTIHTINTNNTTSSPPPSSTGNRKKVAVCVCGYATAGEKTIPQYAAVSSKPYNSAFTVNLLTVTLSTGSFLDSSRGV